MTKKEYLIKIFQKIEPHRSIVGGFVALLESPNCTDSNIENIFAIFAEHISSIQNQDRKNHAQKILDYMKNIKEEESLSQKEDEQDLDRLLDELEYI